jgi:hypothetical protein
MKSCRYCKHVLFSAQEQKSVDFLTRRFKIAGSVTTFELRHFLNISVQAASNMLRDFYKQDLLARVQLNRNAYQYIPTAKFRNIKNGK